MHPYVEAKNNFKACFAKLDKADISSLVGRVAHFVVGLLLLPPILNTITLLFLRLFSYIPEVSSTLSDPGPPVPPPAPQGSGLLTVVVGNSSRASTPKGSQETLPPQTPSEIKKVPAAPQCSGLLTVLGNSSRDPIVSESPCPSKPLSVVPNPPAPQDSNKKTFFLKTRWGMVVERECILEHPPVPRQPSLSPNPTTPVTDQEFIEKFVDAFLWPYIQGKITPEDEQLQPRVSMMESIVDRLIERQTKLSVDEIKRIALNEYLYRSCLGLYVHLGKSSKEPIEPTSPEFEFLVNALTQSLPRDFPNAAWTSEEVRRLAVQALTETNLKRNEGILQSLDYPVAGRKNGNIAG